MPPESNRPESGVPTFEQFSEIFPTSKANTLSDHVAFVSACERFGIDSPARMAAFCAQVAHESIGRTRFVENLNYSEAGMMKTWPRKFKTRAVAVEYKRKGPQAIANKAYAYVNGNGDEASGDGWRFRGRGEIQLTGRANYRRAGAAINLDLENNPEAASDTQVSPLIAAWYWSTIDGNTLADRGDFMELTRRINGGTIGYAHRDALWQKYRTLLGLPAIPSGVAA